MNSYLFNQKDKIETLYEILTKASIKKHEIMPLLASDAIILNILSDFRNNNSFAHSTNPIKKIPKEIGLVFLDDLRNVAKKIMVFSKKI